MMRGVNFKQELWDEAFEECGLNVDFYTTRERSVDEVLPWDFISCGVEKAFFIREWERAKAETVTPNCKMQCQGCGAARFKTGICFDKKN